ncbi:MAG: alpha/beta fold hydrolase [Thermoguttaceae bacterium]|nr:alpha/beta fold hydrolase [Thermoguttaceae bacterium]
MKALIKIAAVFLALLAFPLAAEEKRFEVVREVAGGEPVRLVCIESMPEGAAAETPVAVLCHGFMSNKNDPLICGIADALLARGIGVVRFDFNGHGETGGEFSRMTIANEVLDAEAVLARCAETHPGARFALVGHSQGGVVASLTAARNGSRIAALVLASPAAVIREDMIRGNIFGSWFDPLDPPETVAIMGGNLLVGREYILDAQRRDVYAEAAAYRGPLLVVHGTGDRVVPWTCGERFVREHTGAPAEYRPIPGADHAFSGRIPETTEAITGFLTAAFVQRAQRPNDPAGLPADWSPILVGEPNTAYAKFFIGRSYLHKLTLDQVPAFGVTFEPGCRNNWHIHHAKTGGGQILIVTAGEGYYQEWGKPARRIVKGDTVNIPAGVKHWHGAAPDCWFQHIALEVPGTETSNEWLEPVDDAAYAEAVGRN